MSDETRVDRETLAAALQRHVIPDALTALRVPQEMVDRRFWRATAAAVLALIPAPHPQGGTETLRALADEWQAEADSDERYLNGPNAHYTECQELPAVIARSREHIRDLRALLAAAPAPTEAGESE